MSRFLLIAVVIVTALVTHAIDSRKYDKSRSVVFNVHDLNADEMADAVSWLDEFYRSRDGLQRPGGLVVNGQIDRTAIASWLFQTYIQARAEGDTPEEARARIARAIQGSGEWQGKHPVAP